MLRDDLIQQLKADAEFFERSTRCLSEEDSTFAPKEGMFTVAHQVAHTAQTIEWFMAGMFRPEGFDLDFAAHEQAMKQCASLTEARRWFDRANEAAIQLLSQKSDAELQAPLPAGPVLGGAPRLVCIGAMHDHTAHHRGALTVYSRLLGKVPLMPYGE